MDEYSLTLKYEKLIYKIAKKFYNVELDDLYQAGCIGLIKAYRNYDEASSASFINYAYKYIFGEMYDLANKSRDIKLNKAYLKLYKKIEEARMALAHRIGRMPSSDEICSYLEIDSSLYLEVVTLTSKMMSLDDEYQTLNGDYLPIKECIGESTDYITNMMIEDGIDSLDDMEQKVIKIRYFEDLTQMETAKALGISQVKVSRIENKGKQKIKEFIAA
ncbi:MAG: sigma-70 family RNA polymerase sigma factor [bacterium]|nr:sigma-70 family RNA polymerase sigma factor [bacterium]